MKLVRFSMLFTACVVMIATGCAPTMTWISRPEVQTSANPVYEVRLEPLTEGQPFYTVFRVTVTNKTDKDLKIDWNRTRYIRDGKGLGTFVYRGVKAEDYQNGTIPLDVVGPKKTFSRAVAPLRLVTFARVRERVGEGEGFSPGILPDGENGMALVVVQDGKDIVERLSVEITSQKVQ
jgi:hypothetical protein